MVEIEVSDLVKLINAGFSGKVLFSGSVEGQLRRDRGYTLFYQGGMGEYSLELIFKSELKYRLTKDGVQFYFALADRRARMVGRGGADIGLPIRSPTNATMRMDFLRDIRHL